MLKTNSHTDRAIHPAHELLFQAVRVTLGTHDVARIHALVAQPVDWDTVCQCAHAHDVLPLLHYGLQHVVPDAVPVEVAERLQAAYTANAWRMVMLTGELLALLNAFTAAGISAVPFKGPVLATSLYPDPALRVCSDLDVMVASSEFVQAAAVLEAQGYRPQTGHTYRHHARFQLPNEQVLVELHHKTAAREWRGLDFVTLKPRLAPVVLGGQTVYSLNTADLFSYLCLHGHDHTWIRLKWVVDLALFTSVYPASAWCSTKDDHLPACTLALWLVHTLLNVPLPDVASVTDPQDTYVCRLAATLSQKFFAEREQLSHHERALFERAAYADFRALLAARLKTWLVPRSWDRELIALSGPLAVLYYPLRLVRIVLTRPWLIARGLSRLGWLLWTDARVRVGGLRKTRR